MVFVESRKRIWKFVEQGKKVEKTTANYKLESKQ